MLLNRFTAAFPALLPCVSTWTLPVGLTRRDSTPSTSTIQSDLGSQLCNGSSLYFPSSPGFADLTERWSAGVEGDIMVVVVPGCEKDVTNSVKYANSIDIPFLAINQGHGSPTALRNIKGGMLIKMNKLNAIDVAADGKSATLGGGVYTDQLLAKLAETNKVAATGAGGCVGVVGAGLGGGFGKYMGYTGLISDNILELSVVTANGSEVTVSSSSNPELYWGMRGAGHNFGIVTKLQSKIIDYPKGPDTFWVDYFFSEDKLEALFEQLNTLIDNGNLPIDVNTYVILTLDKDISPKPVFHFQLYYFGTGDEALKYLQPFLDIGPISTSNGTAPYKDIAHAATGTGVGDPLCAGGTTKSLYNVGLKTYNVEANREIYKLHSDMIAEVPDFETSFVQFEGYALQGMQAIDPASSAYAHREDNILVSFSTQYPPSPANDASATKYGKQARQIWLDAEKRQYNSYSNYAQGDETLEQIYGYEPSRLQRLRALKSQWDPEGKFNFYNPIV